MRLFIIFIAGMLVAEGVARWWMSAPPEGLDEPILAYSPSAITAAPESNVTSIDDDALPPATLTLLPDVVARSVPSLHCSHGTVARVDRQDGVTLHLAFFAWDHGTSANVLEAFRHLPDECLGAIGMKLVAVHPPRPFTIDTTTLLFDHTEFRDPSGHPVHAFKAVWVAGTTRLLGDNIRGGSENTRLIRINAAIKRFRPAHARVVQGAVHRLSSPDAAWLAFQNAMLNDLHFTH